MKQHVLFILGLWGFFLLSETVDANFHRQHKLLSDSSLSDLYQGRNKFKCPYPFGVFADPEDCSYYYNCVSGVAVHKKCYRYTKFDVWRKRCLPVYVAICENDKDKTKTTTFATITPDKPTNKDNFVCPNYMGDYPHPNDCSKYYSCMVYRPIVKSCPRNELFDAIKRRCKRERQVHCGDRPIPGLETTTIIIEETTTPSTISTGTIIQSTSTPTATERISESTPTEIETETPTESVTQTVNDPFTNTTHEIIEDITTTRQPTVTEIETETPTEGITQTVSDPSTNTITDGATEDITTTSQPTPPGHNCDEDDPDCIITETGDPKDWFKCPRDIGSFPHPSSDKLFIFCKNWIPSAKKCGLDRVFSKEKSTCIAVSI